MSPAISVSSQPSSPLLDKSRLVNLTSHGPTLGDVAAQMLSEALRGRYPERVLDPDVCMIVSPQWRNGDDAVDPGGSG